MHRPSALHRRHFSLLAALLCIAQPAAATQPAAMPSMLVCMDEQPHPPHFLANGDGAAPLLLRMAAAQAGITVRLYRAPARRCLAEMRAGIAHAFAAATPGPTTLREFIYPKVGGVPDAGRAMIVVRLAVFRRTGATVNWNGARFTGLTAPVLISTGFLATTDRLREMGIPYDDHGATLQQNMEKLLANRGDALLAIDADAAPLLRQPRYAQGVEALPVPFSENHHYLVVTPAFYEANRARVNALWNAMGALRKSDTYAAAVGKLLASQPSAAPTADNTRVAPSQ